MVAPVSRCGGRTGPSVVPSENELQTELNVAGAAGSDHRVGHGDVGRGAGAAERIGYGRIDLKERGIHSIRIGEGGMVEDVEELDAKLRAQSFLDGPVL